MDFWILSLSGGGYRGLFTATLLQELEKALGNPIARHFDLITGTSIGGILGLAIAVIGKNGGLHYLITQ